MNSKVGKNRNKIRKIIFLLFLLIIGCQDEHTPEGVIAMVNGDPITLHALQAMLDCRSPSVMPPQPSLEDTQQSYANALKTLITYTLIHQELKTKGITIDSIAEEQLINKTISDFGKEEFNKYLKDSFIREDEWRQLIKDYLALETFKNRILLPGIKINNDDIKKYYELHKESFKLPDTSKVCFINADSEKDIVDFCSQFKQNNENIFNTAQCMNIANNELPQEWKKEAKSLELYNCAKPKHEENIWRTIVVTDRKKGYDPSIIEVYPLIENILIAQEQQEAFDKWLEEKIKQSKIRITPELNEALTRVGGESIEDKEK